MALGAGHQEARLLVTDSLWPVLKLSPKLLAIDDFEDVF